MLWLFLCLCPYSRMYQLDFTAANDIMVWIRDKQCNISSQTSRRVVTILNTKRNTFFLVKKIPQTDLLHYSGRHCVSWKNNCFANCQSFKSNFETLEVSVMFHLYRNEAKALSDFSHLFRILFSSMPSSKFIRALQAENTRIALNTDEKKRLWSAVRRWSSVACNMYGLLYEH